MDKLKFRHNAPLELTHRTIIEIGEKEIVFLNKRNQKAFEEKLLEEKQKLLKYYEKELENGLLEKEEKYQQIRADDLQKFDKEINRLKENHKTEMKNVTDRNYKKIGQLQSEYEKKYKDELEKVLREKEVANEEKFHKRIEELTKELEYEIHSKCLKKIHEQYEERRQNEIARWNKRSEEKLKKELVKERWKWNEEKEILTKQWHTNEKEFKEHIKHLEEEMEIYKKKNDEIIEEYRLLQANYKKVLDLTGCFQSDVLCNLKYLSKFNEEKVERKEEPDELDKLLREVKYEHLIEEQLKTMKGNREKLREIERIKHQNGKDGRIVAYNEFPSIELQAKNVDKPKYKKITNSCSVLPLTQRFAQTAPSTLKYYSNLIEQDCDIKLPKKHRKQRPATSKVRTKKKLTSDDEMNTSMTSIRVQSMYDKNSMLSRHAANDTTELACYFSSFSSLN
ncbi:hypothetical protein SNEBB_002443 [Seison nebaliae]|nr:hypothetical protein SNEBB_002443 [Seison nebaliae]